MALKISARNVGIFEKPISEVTLKRIAWAFGCAKSDTDEEAELLRLLKDKLEFDRQERPRKPDEHRVEAGDWIRASGDCLCTTCGFEYRDHDTVRGFRWLTRLCGGKLVKL